MSRLVAYGFGFGLAALVAAPGFGDPRADSYPLSTYPMFASRRDKPWLYFVEGVDRTGSTQRLPPRLLGNDEVMQAAATVRRAVQAGPEALELLCRDIAQRVAHEGEPSGLRELRIVAAQFDPVGYFVAGPEPEARNVHFACAVPSAP